MPAMPLTPSHRLDKDAPNGYRESSFLRNPQGSGLLGDRLQVFICPVSCGAAVLGAEQLGLQKLVASRFTCLHVRQGAHRVPMQRMPSMHPRRRTWSWQSARRGTRWSGPCLVKSGSSPGAPCSSSALPSLRHPKGIRCEQDTPQRKDQLHDLNSQFSEAVMHVPPSTFKLADDRQRITVQILSAIMSSCCHNNMQDRCLNPRLLLCAGDRVQGQHCRCHDPEQGGGAAIQQVDGGLVVPPSQ